MTRGINTSLRCQSRYNLSFASITIVVIIPQEMTIHETRYVQVGLMIITLVKVQIPSMMKCNLNNVMGYYVFPPMGTLKKVNPH